METRTEAASEIKTSESKAMTDTQAEIAFMLLDSHYLSLERLKEVLPPEKPLSRMKKNGSSLFHSAIIYRHDQAVSYFIEEKMLLLYSDHELGKSLLFLLYYQKTDLAKALLHYRPEIQKNWQTSRQSSGNNHCTFENNVLHLCMEMRAPDTDLALMLCENNPVVAAYNSKHQTPLLLAAEAGHFQLINTVCEKDPDIIKQHSIEQLCDIFDTLQERGQDNLIKTLLSKDTNLQILCAFELLSNLRDFSLELLKIFMPCTQPLPSNTLLPKETTLLHEASVNQHEEALKYFIDKKMLSSYSDDDLEKLFLDLLSDSAVNLARELLKQRVERADEEKNTPAGNLIVFLKNYTRLPTHSSTNRMFTSLLKSMVANKLIDLLTTDKPVSFRYSEFDLLIDSSGSGSDLLKKIIHTFRLSEPLTGLMKAISETCIKSANGFYQLNKQVSPDLEIIIDQKECSIANRPVAEYKRN